MNVVIIISLAVQKKKNIWKQKVMCAIVQEIGNLMRHQFAISSSSLDNYDLTDQHIAVSGKVDGKTGQWEKCVRSLL